MDKALLNKIRKCLALARSSNEYEAACALAKARALMDEHGVTEDHLKMAEIEEATARANRTLKPPRWETTLNNTVCRALGVTSFIDEIGDRTFVGRGATAEIASYAFAVLFRHLKAARSAYIKSHLRRCKPGRKRQRADVFCEAWAVAVFRKVHALVPRRAPDKLVEQYLAEQHPELVPVGSRAAKPKGGGIEGDIVRGRLAGSEVNLNAGVTGNDETPLALT